MCHEIPNPPSRRHSTTPGAAVRCGVGQTLFEISVMVTVLMVLAGALLPVMGDSIANARVVRARNDAAQIATALANFQRDVGRLAFAGPTPRILSRSRIDSRPVEVLISNGVLPALAHTASAPQLVGPARPGDAAASERNVLGQWLTLSHADALDAHLRFNGRDYPTQAKGPGTGWNGPYLSGEIDADPWGHAYLVNVGVLGGGPSSGDARVACAVFVLSAGPNGIVETPYRQPSSNARACGDDVVVRIQ